MALIPLTYNLDWYDPSKPGGTISTINNNANTATSFDTQYSMQDIIDTVAASGGGISGAGVANNMAYWDGASSITYDSTTDFVYEPVGGGGQPDGRIGLGTSSPNFKMDISGGDLRFENNDGIRFGGTGSNNTYWRIFTTGTTTGEFSIGNNASTPFLTILRSGTQGQIRFDSYGSGTYTGTAAYNLEVDASGNIIETATGGGGATDLNGLSDCLVDTDSVYIAEVPAGLVANPQGNLVVGVDAGNALTGGTDNVFLGNDAGLTATNTTNCVYVGKSAGSGTTIATDNICIGKNSGLYMLNKNFNVFIGNDAGYLRGDRNVAIGYKAFNTFVGGINDGVAIGYQAGLTATSAADSVVFIGKEAGKTVQEAGIIAIGYEAGYSHTTGTTATYLGYQAGYTNTTNGDRTIVGYQAAYYNTGQQVDAFGYRALYGAAGTATGSYNAAFGREAGTLITSGAQNTCIGSSAGKLISTGSNNTVIGSFAGFNTIETGDNNILIGQNAASSTSSVSNEVNLYNGSVVARFQGAAAAWTFVSDERDKKDIEELELGLDFVTKLKPRKFKWDLRDSEVDKNKKASGFIAQEVIEVIDEINADYTGIVNTDNPDQYTVAQANIIPMLVNAVKELKAEVDALKAS